MAHGISPVLLRRLKHPSNWRGILRHKFRRLINAKRRRQRRNACRHSYQGHSVQSESKQVTDGLEEVADHFRSHGWAFVDNFFDGSFHRRLVNSWPGLEWFYLKDNPSKSYDFGPSWSKRLHQRDDGIAQDFYDAFEALSTHEFCNRITEFCGDGIVRATGGPTAVWARTGAHLLPHLDDVSRFGQSVINLIVFVEGTSPAFKSGGTSLFHTNTYDKILFAPPSITNTALLYSTGVPIYHGFPPLGRGKFSKRIIVNYQSLDVFEKEDIIS